MSGYSKTTLQNKYLRIYEDTFGTKILRDDCTHSMYLDMQDFCPQNMIASHISTSYQPNGSGNIHPLSKPIQNITSGSKLDSKLVPFFFFPYTRGERKKAFSSSLFTFILATLLLYIVTAASIANEAKSESIVREGLKPLLFGKRTKTVICIINGSPSINS